MERASQRIHRIPRSGSSGTTTISGGYFKGGGTSPTKADAIKVESGGGTVAYAEGTHLSNATYTVNGQSGYYQVDLRAVAVHI